MVNLIEWIGFLGLLCGMFRVIPQTVKTVKTKNIENLSFLFFLMHMLAGCCGLAYEFLIPLYSIPHVIFFVMVIITNSVQMIYMLMINKKNQPTQEVDL